MIFTKAHTRVTEPALGRSQARFPRSLLLILAVALAIRVWGTWFGQPCFLHPNEPLIAQKALAMLKGPMYDLNPHFFEYPSLYIYVVAIFYALMGLLLYAGGVIEQFFQLYDYATQTLFYFYLLGRIITAMFGAATVYLTYLAARRLLGTTTALLVAWFLTFAYAHFVDSHFLATDVPSAFFVMLALNCCLKALQTGYPRLLYGAGFVSGLAASTKYSAGLVLLTVFTAYLLQARAGGLSWPRALFSSKSLIIPLCAAAGFLLGTPYAILDFKVFAGSLLLQIFHALSGLLRLMESGFFGYFASVVPCGGVGVALMAAACGGMLLSLFLKPRDGYWLLFSFPFLFFLLRGKSALEVDRHLISLIPFWCIYAGIFVARVSERLAAFPWPRRMVAATLALFLSAPSLYYAGKWCWIAVQPDTRVRAAAWMQANIPEETVIATQEAAWMLPLPPDRFRSIPLGAFADASGKKQTPMKLGLLDNPVSDWILQRGIDYPFASAWLDTLRKALNNTPDFDAWRPKSWEYFRAQNALFLITSSLFKQEFFDSAIVAKHPEVARSWQAFYNELEARGKLVKEFVPPAAHEHNWGMGFLKRPIIRIYSIPGT